MLRRYEMWRHRKQGHEITHVRVTAPMFSTDRGDLWKCSCGSRWVA